MLGQEGTQRGSEVMLDYVASIASLGLGTYADCVATECSRLAVKLGGDITIIPSPLVAWMGCSDACLARGDI